MNKHQVLKYLKETELDIQSANAALFVCDLAYSSYAKSKAIHKEVFSPVFCYISYKHLTSFFQFISKKSIDNVGKRLYSDYQKYCKSMDQKIKEQRDLTKKAEAVWKEYNKLGGNPSKNALLKIFNRMMKPIERWWSYAAIGEDKGHIIDAKIVPNFERRHNITKARARSIINDLSHPKEMTIFNNERKDFLQIVKYGHSIKDIFKDKKINKLIASYIKKYFWVNTDFYKTETLTKEKVISSIKKEMNKHSRNEITNELKDIDKNFKAIHTKKKTHTLKLSKEDKADIKFAEKIILWIDIRKHGMMKVDHYALSFLDMISKRFGIDYKEIVLYTLDDLRAFLKSGKKLSKDVMKNRNESVFLMWKNSDKVKLFYGKDSKKMFEVANQTDDTQIKGLVASPGKKKKVIGVAKIVHNPKRETINKDEILVTSQTRLEFVPLMRKAMAVITNEGGLACHASIVSRELGIPCIIGTKNATKILKDGDEVEMDMKTGVVRFIEK